MKYMSSHIEKGTTFLGEKWRKPLALRNMEQFANAITIDDNCHSCSLRANVS